MFFSIGAFAKELGVTPQTLRHWEKIGKLIPHHRTPGGQRIYSREQVIEVLGFLPDRELTIKFVNGKLKKSTFSDLTINELDQIIRLAAQTRRDLIQKDATVEE